MTTYCPICDTTISATGEGDAYDLHCQLYHAIIDAVNELKGGQYDHS